MRVPPCRSAHAAGSGGGGSGRAAVIERRLEHNALLLIIEDLHWADAASVELLRFLVEQLADRRFMLLVSYRPTAELEKPLCEGRAVHTLLRLQALSERDSTRNPSRPV